MISLGTGLWRGQGAGFNPLSLSPALWLDASDSSTLFQSNGGAAAAADGDPVGYITDKSGNGVNLTQTSGTNKPLLKTSIQNSKNIIRFNGTSSYFNFTLAQASPSAVYAVVRTNSTSGNYKSLFERNTTGGSPYAPNYYLAQDVASKPGIYWETSAAINLSTAYNRPVILKYRISPTDVAISVDNGAETTAASSRTKLTSWTQLPSSGQLSAFDLCELVLVNGTVSAANNTALLAYLNSKWAIY